jgi:hypothetical protein
LPHMATRRKYLREVVESNDKVEENVIRVS